MDSAGNVECPVCNRPYGSGVIAQHVNGCLNSTVDKNDRMDKKRKNPEWDFLFKVQNTSNIIAPSAKIAKPSRGIGRPKLNVDSLKHDKSAHVSSSSVSEVEHTRNECVNVEKGKSAVSGQDEVGLNKLRDTDNVDSNFTEKPTGRPTLKALNPMQKKTSNQVAKVPLAECMRPKNLDSFIGQNQVIGKQSLLYILLSRSGNIPSMILWGPPGCGKTTLAKIIAQNCKEQGNAKFITMSATSAGVNEVKEVAKIASNDQKMFGRKTILFLDEIHRFNKTQQDVLLPYVEDGTITFIGATTENPSFYVNAALLSRCRVIVLEKLTIDDIKNIIKRALPFLGVSLRENCADVDLTRIGSGSLEEDSKLPSVMMETDALDALAALVDGDARVALNGLQLAMEVCRGQQQQLTEQNSAHSDRIITVDLVKEALQRTHILYDKTGDEHYNTVSAMIKSMRGSDASAALYWMVRMMEAGENPLYIARRLVVFASEDIGVADPHALPQAVATHQACHFIGPPECVLNLAQCVIYLARAPKSTQVLKALEAARRCVRNHRGALPTVPLHLRNTSSQQLGKFLGPGKDVKCPPDSNGPVGQGYFPSCLSGTNFFCS